MHTHPLLRNVIVSIAIVQLLGCNPTRSPITGTVTYGGNPIDNGGIQFVPLEGGEKATLSSAPIRDGSYIIDATRGPFPGKHRVEIFWNKKTGKKKSSGDHDGATIDETVEGLPAKYNKKSDMTVDVTAGRNNFDFSLVP